MCCWCARVYWTVLQNLFARCYNNLIETNCCYRQSCCSCCHGYQRQASDDAATCRGTDANKQVSSRSRDNDAGSGAFEFQKQTPKHDYIIVEDEDANYAEIEQRSIETESYYFTVDRQTAERMLADREDGACLVRPFKATDICIKYIVSIYAAQQYYHLFVRQIDSRQRYAIGQEKPNERHFPSPCDIIEFYGQNALLCSNKQLSQCVLLKPISYA